MTIIDSHKTNHLAASLLDCPLMAVVSGPHFPCRSAIKSAINLLHISLALFRHKSANSPPECSGPAVLLQAHDYDEHFCN